MADEYYGLRVFYAKWNNEDRKGQKSCDFHHGDYRTKITSELTKQAKTDSKIQSKEWWLSEGKWVGRGRIG